MKLTKLLAGAAASVMAIAVNANAAMEDYSGHHAVLHYAEFITTTEGENAGGIIFFQHDRGNGQLTGDFVYGDPRRMGFNGGTPSVSHAVQFDFPSSDAGLSDQVGDMYGAVAVWDDMTCSDMQLSEEASNGKGVVDRFFESGVINGDWTADLTQIGFLSPAEFEYFAANPNVLGVTFTLSWVDGNGNLTDIDNNGKTDVAFREVYYNDAYNWSDAGNVNVDFPSVANHEVGHGFSMAHFGLISLTGDGQIFVKPRSVMNAVYYEPFATPTGRDEGSHCSNWAQWPNK